MEDSGSANARTGWVPQHAVLRDEGGTVVAVAPIYAKSHSYGEYVFDHGGPTPWSGWASAITPKLQVAVPFSPVPGPRLLRRPGTGVSIGRLPTRCDRRARRTIVVGARDVLSGGRMARPW